MYALGVPVTITIDDNVPLWDSTSMTLFANIGEDKSLWAPLLEKAFAKMHGNYEALVGGFAPAAIYQLTGAPFQTFKHEDLSKEEIWEKLEAADAAHDMITASSHADERGDKVNNADGIPYSHAYTVLGVNKLSTG